MGNANYPSPSNYSDLVDTLVAAEFLSGTFWDNTTRHRILLNRLVGNGANAVHDMKGKYIDLKVKVGEFTGNYRSEGQVRTFTRPNQFTQYQNQAAFYEIPAMLLEEDISFFNTQEAIVKYNKQIVSDMGDDLAKGLNYQLLNSNATANTVAGVAAAASTTNVIYGLPTVFGYGSTAIGYSQSAGTTSSAVSAADKEVLPNVTYCGTSTLPTATITGVTGKITESTSPVITNWSSTGWSAASTTYQTNSVSVWRHMIRRLGMRNTDNAYFPDTGIHTAIMHDQMRAGLGSQTQQHVVLTESAQNPNLGLFAELMIPFEGLKIYPDVDCPAGVGYCLNTKKESALICALPQYVAGVENGKFSGRVPRLVTVGQMPDIDTGAYKLVAKTALNAIFNPYRQAMTYNFA
jgi:hypothetical protein